MNIKQHSLIPPFTGRAFAVMPDGTFDLNDDLESGYGGEELKRAVLARREAGDSMV